jgi:hypothetical protein
MLPYRKQVAEVAWLASPSLNRNSLIPSEGSRTELFSLGSPWMTPYPSFLGDWAGDEPSLEGMGTLRGFPA